jgi:hypothetical protein
MYVKPTDAELAEARRPVVLKPGEEDPLTRTRRYAEAELKRTATREQLVWLYARLPLWLRALQTLSAEVQVHIEAADPGDERTIRPRLAYKRRVDSRVEDVKAMLGPEPAAGHQLAGDVAAAFLSIADAIRAGDLDAARKQAMQNATRWAA